MTFANSYGFLFLIPLAVWLFFELRSGSKHKMAISYSDLSLVENCTEQNFKEEKRLLLLKAASFLLIIIALSRPQSVNKMSEPPKPVVDIMLCLDTSASMYALDFGERNRLDAAKEAAEEFIKKRVYDRMGLVVFGGRAITQCPLTLDHATLIDFLRTISVNATQTDGTAIGNALALSASRLSESEAKSKIIILLTDGRSNVGTIDPVTAARGANDLGIKIYAIGTAVPGGGMIPVDDPLYGRRLAKLEEDLDEPTLLEIARITSAKYYRVTSRKRFDEICNEIDRMEKTKIETGALVQFKDIYLPFLIFSIVFLSLEIFLRATLWRTVP